MAEKSDAVILAEALAEAITSHQQPRQISSANIVLPLAAALSLAIGGVAYGIASGRTQTTLEGLVSEVAGMHRDIGPLTTKAIEMEGKLGTLTEKMATQDRELRLLKDYTEARIGRMPYRESK